MERDRAYILDELLSSVVAAGCASPLCEPVLLLAAFLSRNSFANICLFGRMFVKYFENMLSTQWRVLIKSPKVLSI